MLTSDGATGPKAEMYCCEIVELAFQFVPFRYHKAEFATVIRSGITIGAETVKRIGQHLLGAQRSPRILRQIRCSRDAGIMEVVVGQERPVVTL